MATDCISWLGIAVLVVRAIFHGIGFVRLLYHMYIGLAPLAFDVIRLPRTWYHVACLVCQLVFRFFRVPTNVDEE